ncbi:MAG: HAD-IA family hydrolase [Deltaproteobacteria bacterium]|nr:HAD-IA family hydrolase [Deltaproteobacteria bacterium]
MIPCALPGDTVPLRAVSFDAAGTLFHPVRPIGELYAMVAARHGVTADATDLDRRFRAAFRAAPPLAFPPLAEPERRRREKGWWHAIVREVFAGSPVADFDGYFDALFAFFAGAEAWRADPDAAPLLARLRAAGVRVLVVSNFDARVRDVLAALGLAGAVDAVTISSEAGAAKPDPRIFARALADASLRAHEVLHVGDSAREDLPAARGAGLEVVLVGGPELAAEAPDATCVPRLADAAVYIERRLPRPPRDVR